MAALAPLAIPLLAGATVFQTVQGVRTANFNKKMAQREADYKIQKGKADEQLHRMKMVRLLGEQRTAAGKSGASLLSSTFQDVFNESEANVVADSLLIRSGAELGAGRSLAEAESFGAAATDALVSGALKVGTILTSGSRPSSSSSGPFSFTETDFGI